MSTGTGSPSKLTPKPGGNPKTLVLGVTAVAVGLGLFYYSQLNVHKKDDQTFIDRQNQQVGDKNTTTRIVGATSDAEAKPKPSSYIPTPPPK